MGAFGFYNSKEVRFHHMTMIDNREGFGAALASGNGGLIMLHDNYIYGESEATDCPSDRSYCKSFNKVGFQLTGLAEAGKYIMPHKLP